MAAKRCANCGLVNPSNAMSCDCGYSFATGAIAEAAPGRLQQRSNRAAIVMLVVVVLVGLTIGVMKLLDAADIGDWSL